MSFPSYKEFDIKRIPDKRSYGKAVGRFFEEYNREYESEKEIKKDGDNSTDKR